MSEKPAFDPSQPFEEVKPAFDPSKSFSSADESAPEMGKMEALGRTARQAQTSGFSDEASATMQSGGDSLDSAISKIGITNPTVIAFLKTAIGLPVGAIRNTAGLLANGELPQEYKEPRDIERQKDLAASDSLGGLEKLGANVAGGLANPLAYMVGGGEPIAEGTGYLANIANAGAQGARIGVPLGAAAGFGGSSSENPLEMALETAQGAGQGGVIGGLTGGAAGALLGAPGAAGNALKKFAEKRAVAAEDLPSGVLTAMAKRKGAQGIREVGRDLLDEGVVGYQNSPESLQGRNDALLAKGWQKMSAPLKEIEDSGVTTFNPKNVLDKVKSEFSNLLPEEAQILERFDSIKKLNPQEQLLQEYLLDQQYPNAAILRKIEKVLKSGGGSGEIPVTSATGHKFRKMIDDQIPFNKADPHIKDEIMHFTRNAIKEELNNSVSEAGEAIGKPELVKQFMEGNEDYHLGKIGETPIAAQVGKEFKPVKSVLGAIGKPVDMLSKGIGKTVGNPGLANDLSKILQAAPQFFGRFAPVLQQAAQRGTAAVSAASHVLSQQSEEYREKMRELNNQEINQ